MKDEYMSTDLDAAWIDYILFPPVSLTATGLFDISPNPGIRVFPNPANDKVNIDLLLKQPGVVQVSVSDVLGKEVKPALNYPALATGAHIIAFDLKGLPDGLYLLHIIQNGVVFTKKLVINR
jgi:hypothetical protein